MSLRLDSSVLFSSMYAWKHQSPENSSLEAWNASSCNASVSLAEWSHILSWGSGIFYWMDAVFSHTLLKLFVIINLSKLLGAFDLHLIFMGSAIFFHLYYQCIFLQFLKWHNVLCLPLVFIWSVNSCFGMTSAWVFYLWTMVK